MSEENRLFESLPGYAWRSLADGKLDLLSPGMLRYLGEVSEALRNNWRECIHPDDREGVDSAQSSAVKPEIQYPPLRVRRHDGLYRWFQCSSLDVCQRDVLVARHAIAWDIHDAVLAMQKLRENEAAISTLVDCIPGFVWQLGPGGELNFLNTRVVDYTGKTLDQLREAGWRDAVHPDDVESFIARWTDAYLKTASIVVEFRLRRFDGTFRWFRTTGEPVLDAQQRVVSWCGVDVDIDEEKRTAEGLRSAQSQLARTAQLAIAAELTASTANAINQPLAAIVANAFASQRWLAASPPAIDRAKSILDRIVQDSNELAGIVKGIMAIIKRAPSVNSALNMNSLIDGVLKLLEAELRDSAILVRRHLTDGIPAVHANPALLQQVLVNLIRNSIDALKDKALGEKVLFVDSYRSNTELVVEIGDDGIGFLDGAPLFEAFYTTKPNGLGLGLAIARSIVESYGGRHWARHRDPTGTVVGFSLPL